MLRSHQVMRNCVQYTRKSIQKRYIGQVSKDDAPKDVKPLQPKWSPPPSAGGGGGGKYIALLMGSALLATYVVEKYESAENVLKKYEIPYILEGMAPVRKGFRFIGIGRSSKESVQVPESGTKDDEGQSVDPYAIDEDHSKDLLDEALEDLAEDLLAEVGPLEEEEKQDQHGHEEVVAKEYKQDHEHEQSGESEVVEKKVIDQNDDHSSVNNEGKADASEVCDNLHVIKEETKHASPVQVAEPVVPTSRARLLEARQNALEEVLDGMAKQTSALRDETERCLVHDLDGLDEKALRYRVAQLTTEFFERIKWEGLRQQQALQQAEAVLAHKYGDLLSQQENELKLENERKLFELEKSLLQESSSEVQKLQIAQETRVHNALIQQEKDLTAKFNSDLEKEVNEVTKTIEEGHLLQVVMMRESHVKKLLETQQALMATNAEISALTKMVDTEFSKVAVSASTHALAAAVLMAEEVLVKSAPAGNAIAALKKFAASEPLLEAVVDTLPPSAAKKGVPVLDDIRVRFLVVREETRKAALAPEGTNPILAQMIGNVLSFVSVKPTGNVQGDSVEAALSRIDYHLERNDLDAALKETRSIGGYPRTLMSDWERMVHDRLIVDQAIRSLKTVSALRHLELS